MYIHKTHLFDAFKNCKIGILIVTDLTTNIMMKKKVKHFLYG